MRDAVEDKDERSDKMTKSDSPVQRHSFEIEGGLIKESRKVGEQDRTPECV